jgi:hypothetical protein
MLFDDLEFNALPKARFWLNEHFDIQNSFLSIEGFYFEIANFTLYERKR